MAPEETAEGAPRQFVVRRVSSRGGAQVWVEWLGYPDDRSCWRSLTEHLKKPASCSGSGGGAASGGGGEGGGSVERLAGVHADDRPVGLRVRLLTTSEAAAALSAGNFLRGCPLRPVVNPGGAKGGGGVKKRVKRDKQKVYETKVHRSLVGSCGVSEIREIKRSGKAERMGKGGGGGERRGVFFWRDAPQTKRRKTKAPHTGAWGTRNRRLPTQVHQKRCVCAHVYCARE